MLHPPNTPPPVKSVYSSPEAKKFYKRLESPPQMKKKDDLFTNTPKFQKPSTTKNLSSINQICFNSAEKNDSIKYLTDNTLSNITSNENIDVQDKLH